MPGTPEKSSRRCGRGGKRTVLTGMTCLWPPSEDGGGADTEDGLSDVDVVDDGSSEWCSTDGEDSE